MASQLYGRLALSLGLVLAAPMAAQSTQPTPRQLSLSQAVDQAVRNSPTYAKSLRTTIGAENSIRAAYAGFTPSVSSSLGFGYSGGGSTPVAGQVFQESSRMSSNYNIGISLSLSPDVWYAPRTAKAQERIVNENIASTKSTVTSDVTLQYIATLHASALIEVARQQLARNGSVLRIARAQVAVGSGKPLDVSSAVVDSGRAEYQLLQVLQQETNAKIELVRRMGIIPGTDIDSLHLTEVFALREIVVDVPTLQRMAKDANPGLRISNAQSDAARLAVKVASLRWVPNFSISTGISGSSQAATNSNALVANRFAGAQGSVASCELQNALYSRLTSPLPITNGGIVANCNLAAGLTADGSALAPDVEQAVRDANGGFPFSYKRGPLGFSVGLSLPILDHFQRSNRLSAARVQELDTRDQLRSQEIDLDAQIQRSVGELRTAWSSIKIQEQVRLNAQQQLSLAQAKYNGGTATLLEVQTAQNAVTQAEADYLSAVYTYHTDIVNLETLVGRPLR